ncbi:MAG: AAA family ATPase, partial [Deltaproteobacteria bacterium]|nr:AAA family ATPase [Deltaproteobacteria bacterium]
LEYEYKDLSEATTGGRNNMLNRVAFCLAQLVAGGEIAEGDARATIEQGCLVNGLLDEEPRFTQRTIDSAFTAGMRLPREKPPGADEYTAKDLQRDWAKIVGKHGSDFGGGKVSVSEPESDEGDETAWAPLLLGDTWTAVLDELHRRHKEGFDPVPSGIPELDNILGGGFPRGQTTVMAAPPGFGKTSFALSVCLQWSKLGHPSIFWSLEVPSEDAHCRLVTIDTEGEVSWNDIRSGHNLDIVERVANEHAGLPMALLDRDQLPVDKLGRAVRSMRDQYGEPPLLVIDYAQLLADGDDREARQAADLVAASLLSLAKNEYVPIVALSSVSRAKYQAGNDQMEWLGAAKESGRWESDAAIVVGINPTDTENSRDKRGWIIVAKNRLGGGVGKVGVSFDGKAGTWKYVADDKVPEKRGKLSDPELDTRIIDIVGKHKISDKKQISTMCGVNHKKCCERLAHLMREGTIIQENRKQPFRLASGSSWEAKDASHD